MMRLLQLLLLAAAFAAGTILLGWIAVPVVAACWGAIAYQQRATAFTAGLAAIFSWAGLLGFDAMRGPLGALATTLGGVFGLKAVGVIAVTLALPGLLAVTAAIVSRSLLNAGRGRTVVPVDGVPDIGRRGD